MTTTKPGTVKFDYGYYWSPTDVAEQIYYLLCDESLDLSRVWVWRRTRQFDICGFSTADAWNLLPENDRCIDLATIEEMLVKDMNVDVGKIAPQTKDEDFDAFVQLRKQIKIALTYYLCS
jgi:hypothetical protein